VRDFVAAAKIPAGKYSVSFQSRLGREPWMQPYTDEALVQLAHSGIERLLVLCPAFVADCLETLEEISIRGRDSFLKAGGTDLTLVPCLNEHPAWIDALQAMVTSRWRDAALPPPG
jgi:ferrochelatase